MAPAHSAPLPRPVTQPAGRAARRPPPELVSPTRPIHPTGRARSAHLPHGRPCDEARAGVADGPAGWRRPDCGRRRGALPWPGAGGRRIRRPIVSAAAPAARVYGANDADPGRDALPRGAAAAEMRRPGADPAGDVLPRAGP